MIGQTISHYKILEKLGEGGMGVVYKAHDTKLNRTVALKFLPSKALQSEEEKKRIVREAQAAASLNHPNIATVHEINEIDDQTFIVMEYIDGRSLDLIMRPPYSPPLVRGDKERGLSEDDIEHHVPNPLPINQAIGIAIQIAEGLHEAHVKGIVHRDIKPGNVMVNETGRVKLMDFGLAKMSDASLLTKEGTTLGTVPYMSPEQAQGNEVDHRTDIWSLGVIMYEMLTGQLPFRAGHDAAVLYLIVNEEPGDITKICPDIPISLVQILKKALTKDVGERYQHVSELLMGLKALSTEHSPVDSGVARKGIIALLIVLIVVLTAIGGWFWWQQSRAAWARNVVLPEARALLHEGNGYAAFRLLGKAEAYIPDDPVLNELLSTWVVHATLTTDPPGAEIYIRDFYDSPDDWDFLGRSPLQEIRLPPDFIVLKAAAEGYQTQEVVRRGRLRNLRITLQPSADPPANMVYIPGGPYELRSMPAVQLDDYWIDKYEVTNRQFKEFVDNGGYEEQEYWTEPFIKNGIELSWDESMIFFRDRTGRPGPATWRLGTYAEGEDEYPVSGVSWYEAAAYAAWAGKQLPTIYHWYNAAALQATNELTSYSNFSSSGPEKVGHPLRLGRFGTYDMAGNVKEWVWNETDGNRRFILGGGWNEPSYQFHLDDAQSPFDREPSYGFRCAKFSETLPASLTARIEGPTRDYRHESPAGEEAFAVYERLYHYDRSPFQANVDSVDDSAPYWRLERIEYDAPYGNERIPALLFLPKGVAPPYQAVVWFPGASAFIEGRPMAAAEGYKDWFLFIVRSGRAVLVPMYKGSYERHFGSPFQPHIFRDILIYSGKDLGRSIDYLETRTDIDHEKIAYTGFSMGAGVGPIMTAIEPRFKASVLLAGGLFSWRRAPEVEAVNFLPRVHVPTLMINGRHDFFFPLETSQKPMFDLLGTNPMDKRHRVFDSGHVPSERDEVIREVLDWLDRYLGPVK